MKPYIRQHAWSEFTICKNKRMASLCFYHRFRIIYTTKLCVTCFIWHIVCYHCFSFDTFFIWSVEIIRNSNAMSIIWPLNVPTIPVSVEFYRSEITWKSWWIPLSLSRFILLFLETQPVYVQHYVRYKKCIFIVILSC